MINRSELDDYFMKPYDLQGVGLIYPVKLYNYQRFKYLANKYLVQGNETLFNLYKIPKDTNLLDYFVRKGYESYELNDRLDKELRRIEDNNLKPTNEDEKKYIKSLYAMKDNYTNNKDKMYLIEELKELFSIVFQSDIKFNYINKDNYNFEIISNHNYINRDNFYDIREIVMWENLLIEFPTSPNPYINDMIENAFRLHEKEHSSKGSNMCSIISVVSIKRKISDNEIYEYTYYRLMYDYSIIMKEHGNFLMFMLRSQGCNDAEINDLGEKVDLKPNYDDILLGSSNGMTNLDKKLFH